MTMSVLKMLQITYPQFEISINMSGKLGTASRFIYEIVNGFDVEFSEILCTNLKLIQQNYDIITGHIVYTMRTNENLIFSMLSNLNNKTDLAVEYIPNFYSTYVGNIQKLTVPDNYILMPSCGKETKLSKRKDWGFDNFNSLCTLLVESGYSVVQIGVSTDPRLEKASFVYFNVSLSQLHFLMINCSFFIGLLNGLTVYAGHHGIKTFLLHYQNRSSFDATNYDKQFSIDVTTLKPFDVVEYIRRTEC